MKKQERGKSKSPHFSEVPRDLKGRVFDAEGRRYAAITFEQPAHWRRVLTESEAAVALLAILGKSNGEIATARGVALRTVANQLASVFKKLDVSSRSELTAKATPFSIGSRL